MCILHLGQLAVQAASELGWENIGVFSVSFFPVTVQNQPSERNLAGKRPQEAGGLGGLG